MSQEPSASSGAPNEDLKDMDILCILKIKIESRNSEQGSTKDQWLHPNQDQDTKPSREPPVSSKVPNQDLEDIMFFAPFRINLGSKIQIKCPSKIKDQI